MLLLILLSVQSPAISAPLPQQTPTGVFAQAIGEANVRSGPGIEYEPLGTIYNGTQYAVLGQHEFIPWVMLELDPGSGGQLRPDTIPCR